MHIKAVDKKNKKAITYVSNYSIRVGDNVLQFTLIVFHKDKRKFALADKSFEEVLKKSLTIKPASK